MKRQILWLFLLMSVLGNVPVRALESVPQGTFLLDIILMRPIGLAATVAGAGVFIGMSPLTALASISYPHNAFEKTAQFLVNQPAKFTFARPLGVYYPDDDGRYRLPK